MFTGTSSELMVAVSESETGAGRRNSLEKRNQAGETVEREATLRAFGFRTVNADVLRFSLLDEMDPAHAIIPVRQEDGWSHYNIGGHNFVVLAKYQVQKLIGIGAYGLVWYVFPQISVILRSFYRLCQYMCS